MKKEKPALREAAKESNESLLDVQKKKIGELLENIKKQDSEITRLYNLVEKKENSISRLYSEKEALEEEMEKLKKGEIPAKYFDKALVDEQDGKIKMLEKQKLALLETVVSRNNDIEKLAKERNTLQYKYDSLCEISKLDANKSARMGKAISEKNMEIHKLRKKLANIVANNVNAHALKSAESALAYKDKVIEDKDAVLSDVAEELRISKQREEELIATVKGYLKEIEGLKKELAKSKKSKTLHVCKVHPEIIIPHGDFMEIIKMF